MSGSALKASGALIEQDAKLVEDIDKDFNVTLPLQLNSGAVAIVG